MKRAFTLVFLFFSIVSIYSQSIYWNTYGGACTDVFNSITALPNITASQWSRGANTCTSNTTGFSTTGYNQTSLANAIAANHYVETTLTETGGLTFQLDSFVWIAYRSGTGPTNVDIQYSVNGAPFTSFGSVTSYVSGTTYPFAIPVPAVVPAFGNVRIRMYVWGAASAVGTMRIVQGSHAHVITCIAPTLSTTQTNVLCNGGSTGSIDLTANSGTQPYTYVWAGPSSYSASTEDISGLAAGTYTVTVTASGGCTTSTSATITEPTALSLTTTNTNATCNGASTGSIDLTVSGGTPSYTYLWSNSATTEDINALPAGGYTVTVTDGGGCTATASSNITEPTAIILTSTHTNVSCYGLSNGSIDLSVSGGTPTYTYAWSNSASTQDLTGLAAGPYTVTVTDGAGCTASASATILQPAAINLSTTHINPGCSIVSNGSIDLTVSGGAPGYTYLWSNSATSQDLSGLSNGIYSVVVTDLNGCTTNTSVTLTSPASLNLSATWTNASCNGGHDASIDLTVNSGVPAYTYAWSNSATSQDLTGLTAGTYTVTVTDGSGCTGTYSQVIGEAGLINSFISITACKTYISPSGLYTYTSSGLYSDTLVAANGCDSLIAIDAIIYNPNVTVTAIDHTFHANATGVSYQWVDCNNAFSPLAGATGANYISPVNGSFAVIVTENGCADTSICLVTANTGFDEANLNAFISLYPNPSNGVFNVGIEALEANEVVIEISDISGKVVHNRRVGEVLGTTVVAFTLTDLREGIYFLTIHADGKLKTLRFIKNE